MSDDTPGLLWRLDIRDRNGQSIKGYPKIFSSDTDYIHRLGYWMTKSYSKGLGLTFVTDGCTRTPWLSIESPHVGPVNHWSAAAPGPHPVVECLPEDDDPAWPVDQILDEILRP